ncbi:hypothetical protein [Pseudomonas syringae]
MRAKDYTYDDGDRLLSIQRKQTDTSENSVPPRTGIYLRPAGLVKETIQGTLAYDYDPLGNLTTLTLPTGST